MKKSLRAWEISVKEVVCPSCPQQDVHRSPSMKHCRWAQKEQVVNTLTTATYLQNNKNRQVRSLAQKASSLFQLSTTTRSLKAIQIFGNFIVGWVQEKKTSLAGCKRTQNAYKLLLLLLLLAGDCKFMQWLTSKKEALLKRQTIIHECINSTTTRVAIQRTNYTTAALMPLGYCTHNNGMPFFAIVEL